MNKDVFVISKELFETIYNIKIKRIEVDEFEYIWINIESNTLSRFDSINNFFFKCTDWAFKLKQKYVLLSGYRTCQIHKDNENGSFILLKTFNNIKQKQALFDSCQWILENKEI